MPGALSSSSCTPFIVVQRGRRGMLTTGLAAAIVPTSCSASTKPIGRRRLEIVVTMVRDHKGPKQRGADYCIVECSPGRLQHLDRIPLGGLQLCLFIDFDRGNSLAWGSGGGSSIRSVTGSGRRTGSSPGRVNSGSRRPLCLCPALINLCLPFESDQRSQRPAGIVVSRCQRFPAADQFAKPDLLVAIHGSTLTQHFILQQGGAYDRIPGRPLPASIFSEIATRTASRYSAVPGSRWRRSRALRATSPAAGRSPLPLRCARR